MSTNRCRRRCGASSRVSTASGACTGWSCERAPSMTPDKCPGCGTRLKPDMLACPNCPMSFPEDDGLTDVSNPFKQSRYYQFLLPVLFFGGIAWGVWALAVGFMRLGEENFKKAEDLNLSKEGSIVKG